MPSISKEKFVSMYEKLMLVRMCEERIQKDYFQDEMKTPVHLSIGEEAIAVGVHSALPAYSKIFGTYRNHAIYLAVSNDTDGFWAELYGRATGCGKGKAGSMHMSSPQHGLIATSAVVGTTIPVAVGAAMASVYKKADELSVVFMGDGATEEGVFTESLNFASLKKLPVLFVIEDNDLAIHSKKSHRTRLESVEGIAKAYDILYLRNDGSDISKVFSTTQEILSMMKRRPGPAILHFDYFRFLEHVGPLEDFKFGYRQKPEDSLTKFDPVLKAEEQLHAMGFGLRDRELIKAKIAQRIDKSVEFAKNSPFPEDRELYTDVLVGDRNQHDS